MLREFDWAALCRDCRNNHAPTLFLLFLLQLQRGRVDAIAQTGRLWPVGEDMPEMRAALAAMHLGEAHEKAAVILFTDILGFHRRVEAGPAGAGIELGVGAEQLGAATGAFVRSEER